MEFNLQSDYPKRNRGRPKLGDEIVRPEFKILQFDWNTMRIRTNQFNDNTITEDNNIEDNKSSLNIEHDHVVFDGREIYNKNKT